MKFVQRKVLTHSITIVDFKDDEQKLWSFRVIDTDPTFGVEPISNLEKEFNKLTPKEQNALENFAVRCYEFKFMRELQNEQLIELAKIVAYPSMKASTVRSIEKHKGIVFERKKDMVCSVTFTDPAVIVEIFEDFDFTVYYNIDRVHQMLSGKTIVKAYKYLQSIGFDAMQEI